MSNTVSNPYTFNIASNCSFTGEPQSSATYNVSLTIGNHEDSNDYEYWGAYFHEQFAWGLMTPYIFGEYVIGQCNVVVEDGDTSNAYFNLYFWKLLTDSDTIDYNLGIFTFPNASATINGIEMHHGDAVSTTLLKYMQANIGETIDITIKLN